MTVLFAHRCDDLDTGTINLLPGTLEYHPQMEVVGGASTTTSDKHGGSGSMSLPLSVQGDYGYQSYAGSAFTVAAGTDIYYRWWMKIGSVIWSNGYKAKMNRWGNPSACMTGYMVQDGALPGECLGGYTSPNYPSPTEDPYNDQIPYAFNGAAAHNWQEYIVRMKVHNVGQSDGVFALYVYDAAGNGGLIGQVTGIKWFQTGDSSITEMKGCWGLYMFPQDISGTILIDDVIVATSLAEVHAGGPPPPVYDGSMTLAVT